ncbi:MULTISPECIES: FadR/GntR family transcriptional regulator [Rhodococcus]|uniref:FadR/GntR family transcriptional regulator n=1 Tax=Rhodococcus TaxID=1827 RepID=UPI000BD7A2D5|nr:MULTISPECIES: FCD domain-containing protein [unclassified Rhodococcus (in: high G+C Gram-positive bacteria)]MBP1161978.1 DNA-binding FadR family transcriptional regulator [Rhodococcus sp. PvR099]PTR43311.1 GntR family transcriptional regulator [Rhodococcus sp. OK611]SNX91174.1 transcriptional regulator, GntR family [Rhodococcus sp. OK270]
MNSQLRSGPLVPQLERLLRERISSGHWAAGQRLPRESDLATELGVGRSSIREAVRLLAQDGQLIVRHGVGTFVTESGATPSASDLPRLLRRARLLEVFEVRRALEVEAARLAAARARSHDLSAIRSGLAARHSLLGNDIEDFVDADLDFHASIVTLSGNAVLASLFASVRPLLRDALIELEKDEPDHPDTSSAHDDLLAAIEAQDGAAAMAAVAANIDSVITALQIEDNA